MIEISGNAFQFAATIESTCNLHSEMTSCQTSSSGITDRCLGRRSRDNSSSAVTANMMAIKPHH